jgi:TPP-dependent pyruvate/acetoin dehydrogenase alpha subunit
LQHLGIDKDSAFKNNNSKSLNKLDPYILIKKYILKKRYFNKNQIDKIENNILNQINKDLKFIKKSNTPNSLKNYKPFYE